MPRFVLDLDDISDAAEVEEFELPDVKTPEQPQVLALGSELRIRVPSQVQAVPSELDVALMAYLLDLDPPPD
jgi:hypothetical protein